MRRSHGAVWSVICAAVAVRVALPTADLAAREIDGLEWVQIPAASFEMGCVAGDTRCQPNETPRHSITLSRPFELMAKEVTVAQFRAYAAAIGERAPRQPAWNVDDHPVVNVSWVELRDFCAWNGGRLPTEAEWEFAARGGRSGSIFSWGDVYDRNRANGWRQAGRDVWRQTAPVASFPPNGYGLYDTIGNVWEWVNDWYWERQYTAFAEQDPSGPPDGEFRVLRGGSWANTAPQLRTSFRFRRPATGRYTLYIGGRCARDPTR